MGYLTILVFLAVVVSAHCTGCIWLAVPSLAYEGYKYEYPSNTRSSRQGSGRSSNSRSVSGKSAPSDHSIE